MKLKATGIFFVMKAVPIEVRQEDKVRASGLIMPSKFNEIKDGVEINSPTKNGKIRVKLFVDSIGSGVDTEKIDIKVGDEVYPNDYDIQVFGTNNDDIYCLCKAESIKAVKIED